MIRTACKWSFHAYMLSAAVTQLHRKISSFPKQSKAKPDVIYAGAALLFELLCYSCSVSLSSLFA